MLLVGDLSVKDTWERARDLWSLCMKEALNNKQIGQCGAVIQQEVIHKASSNAPLKHIGNKRHCNKSI